MDLPSGTGNDCMFALEPSGVGSLNIYRCVCHVRLQCVKSLFLWGCVSVGVTIKSIYRVGETTRQEKISPCATSGHTSFNEAGLHLAASHRSSLHPCHSAKAVRCQHARPYERPRNLHTYNMKVVYCTLWYLQSGLIECSWWISCFILMFFIACIKFACVDFF